MIKVLMEDNLQGADLCAEHGLSFYVETKKHKLLVDSGAGEKTWQNAEKLGVDIKQIDTLILSHGHYDHSGGILSFAEQNKKAKIYLRANADGDYYNNKTGVEKYIGIDKRIFTLPNVSAVQDDCVIDEELSLFTHISGRELWPSGNKTLLKKENGIFLQDDFSHEQCLVIKEDGEYTLISGCAHNGILNILSRFKEIYGCEPKKVFSGFHMMKDVFTGEDAKNVHTTALKLQKMNTVFYTGHCTGEPAYRILKEIMGEQIHSLSSFNNQKENPTES